MINPTFIPTRQPLTDPQIPDETLDYLLADALARGATWAEAATLGKCPIHVVRLRMRNVDFRLLITENRQSLHLQTAGILSQVSVTAVRALENLIHTGTPSQQFACRADDTQIQHRI